MRLGRRGLSLLEAVLALVVLAVVIVPVADSFSSLRTGFVKINRHAVAMSLTRAVMDHIHWRLYNDDSRFVELLQKDGDKVAAAAGGAGQAFFDTMAEAARTVTYDDPAKTSTYFVRINDLTKSGVFGITKANDPDLFAQLKDYRCSVDVYYSLPYDILDSDVDGQPEIDMAEIKVTISWDDKGTTRSQELWTVFTKRQYNDLQ